MSELTKLAKKTVESYLYDEKLPESSDFTTKILAERHACFVSIHKKDDGTLRGCIGTIVPTYKNLAAEIIANAYEAAFRDERFTPVKKDELNNLSFSIDVLSEPEAISSYEFLNPKKYGVIVKALADNRTGLLLPNLDDINTSDRQIAIARAKAGIGPDEEIRLFRFESKRFD